jgi:hypothetical protein
MTPLNDSRTEESRLAIPDFLQVFRGPVDIRTVGLTGISLLFTLYSFYFARASTMAEAYSCAGISTTASMSS